MKIRPMIASLLLAAGAIGMQGCGATQLPGPISSQLISIRAEIAASRSSIVQVGVSLKNLRESSSADLAAAFRNYSRDFDAMQKRAGEAGAVVTTRQSQSEEYFGNWEREISQLQSEDLRDRAESRRAEANEAYQEVKSRIVALRASFQAYMNSARDTQRFLANDLTPAGKKEATPFINAALKQHEVVLKNLDEVVASIDKLRIK